MKRNDADAQYLFWLAQYAVRNPSRKASLPNFPSPEALPTADEILEAISQGADPVEKWPVGEVIRVPRATTFTEISGPLVSLDGAHATIELTPPKVRLNMPFEEVDLMGEYRDRLHKELDSLLLSEMDRRAFQQRIIAQGLEAVAPRVLIVEPGNPRETKSPAARPIGLWIYDEQQTTGCSQAEAIRRFFEKYEDDLPNLKIKLTYPEDRIKQWARITNKSVKEIRVLPMTN